MFKKMRNDKNNVEKSLDFVISVIFDVDIKHNLLNFSKESFQADENCCSW